MYPLLILREELVCLVILIFLMLLSRTYRKGKDGRLFNRLLISAAIHVVMDGVTVWTVNHTETVPYALNCAAHIVFYIAAILFAKEILIYSVRLLYPGQEDKWNRAGLILTALYVAALPFMQIQFRQFHGTWASAGFAAYAGYGVGYVFFFLSMALLLRNWKDLSLRVKTTLLPMMLILLTAETVQILVPEFLFTGGAVTIVTVGFFFSLESPNIVMERYAMTDAMTGVENRNCYERDIQEYDRQYRSDPKQKFTFLFADMNNLKSVNGMYGHDAGDEYITFIAVTLRNTLKDAEHIYRMGGDEFLAIFLNKDESAVIRGIEKIREACEQERMHKKYNPVLALGYAVSGPQYQSLHDVLKVADYMMYQNKAELKRENAMEAGHKGTALNLTGLTDRLFDAMCLSGEGYYPFIRNLETGVTRVAPGLAKRFGLEDSFFADFRSVWTERIHPDDRNTFLNGLDAVLNGEKRRVDSCRVMDAAGNYVPVSVSGGVYRGTDGEPDLLTGYMACPDGKPN